MNSLPAMGRDSGGYIPALGSQDGDAINLGRFYDFEGGGIGPKLMYGGDRNIVLFGPNGSGKSLRIAAPNLLQCTDRSIFVIDPKGELAAITAPFRRTVSDVVILNPFDMFLDVPGYEDLRSHGFNPLADLDPDSDMFNSEVELRADALIQIRSHDPHWDESARNLVAALIMYEVIEARKRGRIPTLGKVRDFLAMPVIQKRDGPLEGFLRIVREMSLSDYTPLSNKAAQFGKWSDEIDSIMSAARRQTTPFDDPPMVRDLAKDGVRFSDMKTRPMTVYCVIPTKMVTRHATWLRLVLTAALQGVLRERRPGEPKTLFMMDEFAALGHLEIIETVWAVVRGYGVQLMPMFQDLNQLKGLYKERWETFIGNAGAVLSFAANDMTTAEWLSRRAGDTTRVVESYHEGTNTTPFTGTKSPGGTSSNSSHNYTQTKVPLIDPHKFFGLRDGAMIAMLAGVADVVPAYAPGYWQIDQCAMRARANPYRFG